MPINDEQRAVIEELQRRRATLSPEQQATVDELSKRLGAEASPTKPAAAPAAEKRSWVDSVADTIGAWWNEVSPVQQLKGAAEAVRHPVDAVVGIGKAQDEVRLRAQEAFQRGDYGGALRHGLAFLVPLLGPGADAAGNKLEAGKYAEGLGQTAGIATNILLPNAMARAKQVRVPVLRLPNPNAAETAATNYLRDAAKVEPGAAASTGNGFVKGAQKLVDYTPGGAVVAARRDALNNRNLRTHAQQLTERAHPDPATPYTAGEDVRAALEGRRNAQIHTPAPPAGTAGPGGIVATGEALAARVHPQSQSPLQAGLAARGGLEKRAVKLGETADTAYNEFRSIETNPANVVEVQVGLEVPAQLDDLSRSLSGQPFDKLAPAAQAQMVDTAVAMGIEPARPVMRQISMPVDMRPIKDAVLPIYQDMRQWMEPAKKNASAGFTAMKSILEGDDFLSASQAEKGLSGLKTLAREGKYQHAGGEAFQAGMRDVNQGVGANAVRLLQEGIDTAVARSTHEPGRALQLLRRGREMTRGKYEVADIVQQLRQEPVQTFKQLTWRDDAGVSFLAQANRAAPKEMARVGRAWLDEVRQAATGDLSNAAGLADAWRSLGPKTKEILFKKPELRTQLDSFFGSLQQFADNPGPLKRLQNPEPVRVFDALVQPKDANITLLREVSREASGQATKVGRAYLENLFGKMTSQGGINHADSLWASWRDLGPQTKDLLFPSPRHRGDLDKFFLGLKKISENPNPSGSALVGWIGAQGAGIAGLQVFDPRALATYVLGPAAISKILHSPAGVRLLTQGILPGSGKAHAAANITAQLLRIAGEDSKKVE